MLDTLGKLITKKFICRPVFIVGGGRSGTIALFKAMGKHPELLIAPGEDPFITDVGGMVYDLEYANDREKQYYLRSLRISQEYLQDSLRRLCLESALGSHYGLKHLIKITAKEKTNLLGKRYWCTKTFPNASVAKGLLRLYPDAKFIYILRNGLNVVHSRTKFPEFRGRSFEEHCQRWANNVTRFNYLFELPEAMIVRQEDLANKPETVFHRIFEHLGLTHHSGPVSYAKTTHVHPLADESTAQGVDVAKMLRERPPVYESWTDAQKDMFKRICGSAMTSAGYDVPF